MTNPTWPAEPDVSPLGANRRADRERLARAIAGEPIFPVRVLTPPRLSGDLPRDLFRIVVLYVLLLPFRLIAAAVAVPFTIHNQPLGAVIGFVALFGFWEVWENIVKVPLVGLQNYEAMKYEQSADINKSVGNVMYSNYRGTKDALPVIWQASTAALFGKAGPYEPHGFEGMVLRFSNVIDRETRNQTRKTREAIAGRNFLPGAPPVPRASNPQAPAYSPPPRVQPLTLAHQRYRAGDACAVGYASITAAQARQIASGEPVELPNDPRQGLSVMDGRTIITPLVDASGTVIRETTHGRQMALVSTGLSRFALVNWSDYQCVERRSGR